MKFFDHITDIEAVPVKQAPEDPGYDLDESLRRYGFDLVLFCDGVTFDSAMTTGPEVYARRTDGTWVRSCMWLALAGGNFEPCAGPPTINESARQRKADWLRRLFAPHPEYQDAEGLEHTIERAMRLL